MTKKKGTIETLLPKSITGMINDHHKVRTEIVAVDDFFIPGYQTSGAACCDLRAYLPDGPLLLSPGMTALVDCGIKIKMPVGYEAQIRARSGLAKQGIIATNANEEPGGTIDEDYINKPIKVILTNFSKNGLMIHPGDRIAQMAIKPVWYFDFNKVSAIEDVETDRTGGFGSTNIT